MGFGIRLYTQSPNAMPAFERLRVNGREFMPIPGGTWTCGILEVPN